jgi:hypothetical protein
MPLAATTLKQIAVLADSISMAQSAVLVTLFSVLVVWPVRRVRLLNAVTAVAVPAGLAYCLYWLPVWLDPPDLNSMEDLHRLDVYNAWSGLMVTTMLLPAFLVSLIVVAVADRRARRPRPAQ